LNILMDLRRATYLFLVYDIPRSQICFSGSRFTVICISLLCTSIYSHRFGLALEIIFQRLCSDINELITSLRDLESKSEPNNTNFATNFTKTPLIVLNSIPHVANTSEHPITTQESTASKRKYNPKAQSDYSAGFVSFSVTPLVTGSPIGAAADDSSPATVSIV